MEVEEVASTDIMVGAEGANMCVIAGKYMMGNVEQVLANGWRSVATRKAQHRHSPYLFPVLVFWVLEHLCLHYPFAYLHVWGSLRYV